MTPDVNTEDVRSRFAYNRWANRRLAEATGRLAADDYARDMNASFASIRGTLIHLLWAEWWWLRVWQGSTPPRQFDAEMFPDVSALAAGWTELEREQDAFLSRLSDGQLEHRRSVRGYEYTLGELVHHLLNHSTYHRGQVAMLLRQIGEEPPATDFRLFLTELRYGASY